MILAGITLFNPEMDRIDENIAAVIDQVDAVLCVDNGSSNLQEIEEKVLSKYPADKLIVEKNGDNLGIARALNQMFEYAKANGYEWVLTLDQDSVVPDNIISEYKKYTDKLENIGSLSPLILDRNYGNNEDNKGDVEELDKCITSASLTPVEAWEKVGGFFEELFIDLVDHDFCAKLVENGYKIYRINTVKLLHELGHGVSHRFLGKKITVMNHSPFRKYYIVRNRLIYMYMHKNSINIKKEKIKYYMFLIKTVLYEKDKMKKFKVMRKGAKDGKAFIKKMKAENGGN
ncbi:rhamnosyltransferase [Lachnospiraceae bacterium C7]|nr:rhamnosyltransferase [Lachnospiraceae bacterium C7]